MGLKMNVEVEKGSQDRAGKRNMVEGKVTTVTQCQAHQTAGIPGRSQHLSNISGRKEVR